ncbi:hypothetical protein ABKY54_004527 [Vibrio harveyi]
MKDLNLVDVLFLTGPAAAQTKKIELLDVARLMTDDKFYQEELGNGTVDHYAIALDKDFGFVAFFAGSTYGPVKPVEKMNLIDEDKKFDWWGNNPKHMNNPDIQTFIKENTPLPEFSFVPLSRNALNKSDAKSVFRELTEERIREQNENDEREKIQHLDFAWLHQTVDRINERRRTLNSENMEELTASLNDAKSGGAGYLTVTIEEGGYIRFTHLDRENIKTAKTE